MSGVSPRSQRFQALRRLLAEFKPYRGRVAGVLLLGLVISSIQPICLKITQQIVDGLQSTQSEMSGNFFRWVPISLAGVFLISGLAKYFYNSFRRYTSERVIIGLRSRLFEKYLALPVSSIDDKRTGDMVSSLQNDLHQVSVGLDTLCDILKEPFVFVGLLGVAFYYDWRLASATLIAAPIVVFLFSRSGAAVKRYSGRNLGQFSDLISLSSEALSGSRVVKVFQLENTLKEKFDRVHEKYFTTLYKSIRVQELATPMVEFVGACLMGAVVIYGKHRISQGELTTGELLAFIFALGLIQMPIKQMNNAYLKLKHAEAAADRVYAALDAPITVREIPGARRIRGLNDGIAFDRVGLHYGDKRALGGISFEVRRGQTVALVGPSGSGKSSLVNLIPRLYDVTEGRILVDGYDLKSLSVSDLRRLVSFVTQETFLFNDTIFENIRMGRSSASAEEVYRAAEAAHCTAFVSRQPQGFETFIGDRGVRLSGGERQRVAIARALLKEAPILVLDEATSNLDSTSEALVQSALENLMFGRTTFLVAHRFSTIRRADRIIVLENGAVKEEGKHETLLDRGGLYKDLYSRQFIEA